MRACPRSLAGDYESLLAEFFTKVGQEEFSCLACSYLAKKRHHMINHVEANHARSRHGHLCDFCLKVCPTKNALSAHKSRIHYKTHQRLDSVALPSE
jgi:hypothetical protein